MDEAGSLPYIVNHVFLPPKLPQEDDSDLENDTALLEQCEAALRSYQAQTFPHEQWRWAACSAMVSTMLRTRNYSGGFSPEKIEKSLREITGKGSPVHYPIFSPFF